MSGALSPELVRHGYALGYFPMADEQDQIAWYAPRMRALFPIDGIRVSRSLAKTIRSGRFEVRFDTVFEQVVRSCRREDGNWISEEIVHVYTEIHRLGWAHSAECWREGALVGGLYGIAMGRCFCAESMFHRERDASKIALWAMVNRCRELDFSMFDAQIMNPHLASLGAFEIPQAEYLVRLQEAMT